MSYSFSVIVSTFNSELWLHKVLIGFNNQTYKDFELIVADDGSNHKTRDLIEKIKHNVFYKLTHVWQPDHGFQKTIILNKALLKSNGNYIVFTDGDCIPRSDFLETHNKLRALIFPAFQYPIVNGKEVKRSLYKNGKFICEYV